MKDKSVAVILAVFLSFWTWLYTYSLNSKKFWIGILVSIFGMIVLGFLAPFGVWIWAIVDSVSRDTKEYKKIK